MAAKQFFVPTNHATIRGIAEPGATANLYTTGTLVPQNFYSDSALTMSLGSSIQANGAGYFPIAYQDENTAFRLILNDRNGAELDGGDIDPYYFGDVSSTDAAASAVAAAASAAAAAAAAVAAQAALSNATADQSLSQVVTGLGVEWTGSLNFTMSAGTYYINGTLYSAIEQSITLSTADATNPRIDVLAVDTSGTFVKVTGTPAANPSQPDIDPETQLFLKFVLVPAGATAPVIDADEIVYEENDGVGEWTGSVVAGTSIALNSTSEPDSGTTCIAATSAGNSAAGSIRLDKGSTISVDTLDSLVIRFKSKTASWGTGRIRILFQNASGVRVGTILSIQNTAFGLTTSNVTSYQTLTIPISRFAIPAGTALQYLQIADTTGAAISWRMDNIKLKKSSAAVGGTTGGISQAQADARYAQRANNLSDLTNPATARDNLGLHTVTTDSTTARTAALADADTFIRFTNASAVTFTIPPNSSVAFVIGTEINFSQSGAGAVSVAPGSGVTINSRASDLTLAGQYAVAFVKKVATDTWIMNGDL